MIYRELKKGEIGCVLILLEMFCQELKEDQYAIQGVFTNVMRGYERIFVAENGNGIIGMAGYLGLGNIALAEILFVLPKYRKGLIGGRLFNTARKDAKKNGFKRVRILATPEKAELYENLGFSKTHYLLDAEV
jgi:N-acetylglutamate synthase-like GNAT family acetyltransferase